MKKNTDANANKKDYSSRISELIKEKLKDYLENIEFNMSFNYSHYVFYVKDVEIRNDLLKKYGIPLELIKGKVQQIKLTVLYIFFMIDSKSYWYKAYFS